MRRTSRTCLMLRQSMCAAPDRPSNRVADPFVAIVHQISWLKFFPRLWVSLACPRGGTGRRAALKMRFRKECPFDSGRGHHLHMSQKRPRTGLWIMFDRGEMHRTGITPNPRNDSRTPVMLATRIPDGIRPSPFNRTREDLWARDRGPITSWQFNLRINRQEPSPHLLDSD